MVEPGEITNTLLPVISGTPQVDQPLTTTSGSWNPTPQSISYQWFADGTPIDGATSPTFVPGPAQVDRQLSVAATATKAGYDDVTAVSISSAPVALGQFSVADGGPRAWRLSSGRDHPARRRHLVAERGHHDGGMAA